MGKRDGFGVKGERLSGMEFDKGNRAHLLKITAGTPEDSGP